MSTDDQNQRTTTDSPQDTTPEQQVVDQQSVSDTNLVSQGEAEPGADSPLSEAGEASNESTSSDVHESGRADSEQSSEAELESQGQASELINSEDATDDDSADEAQSANEDMSESSSNAKWYVVHTYSGHENRVAQTLKQRVESEKLGDKILEVLVPTQDKIEIRSGKKETVKEKIFPGYILVKMILDDASWLAVRTTQGVTSFVGMGNKPTPIPEHEVHSIVTFMTQGAAPTYKQIFNEGDTVKIVDGPFSEFIGKIESVDKDRGKVRVLVSIFGRETPVELDFLQVAKL